MAKNNTFCEECGNSITVDEVFCSSCGAKQPERSGKFSAISGFSSPSQMEPVMAQAAESWEGGTLFDTAKNFVLHTKSAAPQAMQAYDAPNPTVIVIIYGFLSGIIAGFELQKTSYIFGDGITQEIQNDVLASIPSFFTSLTISLLGVLVSWWIGSWLLGIFVKGGFPLNSPIRQRASDAMRKLNAYRYIPLLIVGLVQLAILSTAPNQVISYDMGVIEFFGQRIEGPVPTVTGFGGTYSLASTLLQLIATGYALYMMYQAIMANGYKGTAFYIILALIFYLNIILPVQFLF